MIAISRRFGLLTVLSLAACGGRTDVGDLLPESDGGGASGGQTGNGGLPFFTGGAWGIGGAAPTGGVPVGAGGLWSGGALATGGAFVTGGAFWAGGSGPGGSGGSGGLICPAEYFDPPGGPLGDCTPVSHCAPGWYVSKQPTPFSDRACRICSGGYSLDADSYSCINWSSCAFDQLIEVSGTPTSDVVCGPNPRIHALPVGEYVPQLSTPPGEVLLATTYGPTPHFRRFTSPGLSLFEDVHLDHYGSYPGEVRLLRGSGSRVFYLETRGAQLPNGYLPTPAANLIEGSPASPVWQSTTGLYGNHLGAAVLTDDTLVALASTYENYVWGFKLLRWSLDGTFAAQAIDPDLVGYYQYPRLLGRDGANNLYVLRYEPLEIVRLDSSGNFVSSTELSEHFSWANGGAVTTSGAAYVTGSDYFGNILVVRVETDGTISFAFPWPGGYPPPFMRALGENLLAGGATRQAWTHPVQGDEDALVLELSPVGTEVRSWQFGGSAADSVEAGDVADDGRITVAAYEYYSTQLVELLP